MQSANALVTLAALLLVKHFFADGPLQSDYQIGNKGRFLHPGGLMHAGIHAGLSALCIAFCFAHFSIGPDSFGAQARMIAIIAGLEFVVHYTIDWLKCFSNDAAGWAESQMTETGQRVLTIKNSMFFHAFLADQLLHNLTYVAIIFAVAKMS